MSERPQQADRDLQRVLRFLTPGEASLRAGAATDRVLLAADGRGVIGVARAAIDDLTARGLCRMQGDRLAITETGRANRRRAEAGADGFLAQHRTLETQQIVDGEEIRSARVNLDESPLRSIARRLDRNGNRTLDDREVAAGERLRADYTRGQMMPRLGANWQAAVASGRRDGRGGIADITDAALAARMRVDKALTAVGPELSGVLVDVCCFLKGLELVERERGWPVRSAKVVLKTALSVLSRHYEPPARPRQQVLHWGAEGYRPTL